MHKKVFRQLIFCAIIDSEDLVSTDDTFCYGLIDQ